MAAERFDRYEVKSELGQGGMATVYLAHDPRFGRDVALKVMSYALRDDPTFRGRFQREARTVATLEHPAIVPVYDFGEDHEQLYLVMRYMPGGSLAERIIHHPLSVDEAIPILERIGSALDHAHRQGVIHRDLKPGNVLFDQYNNAFLSDFGIVKVAEGTTAASLTGSGVIGTPAYMSPEQIHGEVEIDGRSDVYTLGIILFEMLTGLKPYRAETPVKQMMAHVLDPVPNILEVKPELPPACDTIVRRALAKERDERFTSASELTAALSLTTGERAPPVFSPPAVPKAPVVVTPDDSPTETAVHAPQKEDVVPVAAPEISPADSSSLSPALDGDVAEADKVERPWLWWIVVVAALLIVVAGFIFLPGFFTTTIEPTSVPEVIVATTNTPSSIPSPTPSATPSPEPTATATPTETPVPPTGSPTQFPTPALIEYGRSALDMPLEAIRFGTGEHVVLFVGGLHAGFAPATVTLAEEMIAYYTDNLAEIPENVSLVIIVNANPDSIEGPGTLDGRMNGNGVDLNRNWDCRWVSDPPWGGTPVPGLGGTAPFSEPEIAGLRAFILAEAVEAVVFWQARATSGLVSPGACDDGSLASQPLADIYGEAAGYQIFDFESFVDQVVNGDGTNWLDAQAIPAISVLLPDYRDMDLENNLAGAQAVLEWVSNGALP